MDSRAGLDMVVKKSVLETEPQMPSFPSPIILVNTLTELGLEILMGG